MMPIQCATCQYYQADNKCRAFPAGIPPRIITGEIDHDKKMFGQKNDFIYKEKKSSL